MPAIDFQLNAVKATAFIFICGRFWSLLPPAALYSGIHLGNSGKWLTSRECAKRVKGSSSSQHLCTQNISHLRFIAMSESGDVHVRCQRKEKYENNQARTFSTSWSASQPNAWDQFSTSESEVTVPSGRRRRALSRLGSTV